MSLTITKEEAIEAIKNAGRFVSGTAISAVGDCGCAVGTIMLEKMTREELYQRGLSYSDALENPYMDHLSQVFEGKADELGLGDLEKTWDPDKVSALAKASIDHIREYWPEEVVIERYD